jgi:hypothetical protein
VEIISGIDLGYCGDGGVFVSYTGIRSDKLDLERRDGKLE